MKLFFRRARWCIKVTGWILQNRAVYVFVSATCKVEKAGALPRRVAEQFHEWVPRNYAKQIGQKLLLKKELKTLGDF